jgi:hypothetical protein
VTTESTDTRLALIEARTDRTERIVEALAENLKMLVRIELQNGHIANEQRQLRADMREHREVAEKDLAALTVDVATLKAEMPPLLQIKAAAFGALKMLLVSVFVAIFAIVGLKPH